MELLIKIPKEFEQHFKQDAFKNSLRRLSFDAHLVAGLYEQEIAEMLEDAFRNAVSVPPHGDLIDRDAARENIKPWSPEDEMNGCTFDTVKKLMYTMLDRAHVIIPAEEDE